ncbi:hypothetical protein DE146DRAFT_769246 [Phaeosphaeria sp. MPI-PUGE-AT-0046c]|nr:hypothetical protein DE146DRAFT_774743 [Phaeosphaeria sp. MPI-PUGE-AT-0046c]KAH7385367.1 hypothetical protein DE146DRAFT_769246 [Phaeosphaeria sp. MPI-PUGE-AT-0046c]
MDIAANDSDGVRPVHILRERVGKAGEGDGEARREVVMVDVFEKYEILEETVFALCNIIRNEFLLHFHLESHDRCNVRLKDSHWNKGTYFRSNLFSDGALLLIPHFVPLVPRPDGVKKRGFEDMEVPMASFGAKKKRMENVKASPLPTIAEDADEPALHTTMEVTNLNGSDEIVDSVENNDPAGANTTEHETLTSRRPMKPVRRPIGDLDFYAVSVHGKFVTSATTPLSPKFTCATWLPAMANARERYINKHLDGITPARNTVVHSAISRTVHVEMINGLYGMTAQDPCIHCIRAGETCRVYHSDCYKWGKGESGRTVAATLQFG